jgi:nicotinate (nicotinamide) nucleotide adenylyltransferase
MYFKIKICDFEVKSNMFWQIYDLLKALSEENPGVKFNFVAGTDVLSKVKDWDNGEKLLEEFEFIICKRLKYDLDKQFYPKNYKILQSYIDASSSKIRNRISNHIKEGKKLDLGICGLTTKSVIDYIIENNLYREY